MKILLYTDKEKTIEKSGLGKAIVHQMKALELAGVSYTTDPNDDFDILHINTYFPASYIFAKKAKKNNKKIVYHAHSTEEDFRDGFIFCKQLSPLFKKWLIKCYNLGDVIVTPTLYSKKLLLIQRKTTLELLKLEIEQKQNDVEEYIASIDDSRMRRIVSMRFIDNLSWNQVADRIGGGNTEGSVKMAFQRFMKE